MKHLRALALLLILAAGGAVNPPLPASAGEDPGYLDQVSRNVGWGGERLAMQASEGAEEFRLLGAAGDNARRRVVLWDVVKWVRGEHLPTLRQQIGDCVGFGAAQGVDYLQYVQVVLYARQETPKRVFVPYHYACGRNAPECGAGRIRGPDGSIGSWQAKALQIYGVVASDHPGLPGYSGAVARQWAVRMPAAELVEVGKRHVVKTIALVTTAEQATDAICNGYPITIASDWGGLMTPPLVGDKRVNRRATRWMHQMVLIGYDGSGAEPYWYVLNSWGDAHGAPQDGAPVGGFWIRRGDLENILRQRDSWALSDLETGFESRDISIDGLVRRTYFRGRTYAYGPPLRSDPSGGRDRRDLRDAGLPVDGAVPRSGSRGRTLVVRTGDRVDAGDVEPGRAAR